MAAAANATKARRGAASTGKKTGRGAAKENAGITKDSQNVYRVFKRICDPENENKMGMSTRAMSLLEHMLDHAQDRIVMAAHQEMKYEGKTTLKKKHAFAGASVVMSGDLAKHANADGKRACDAFRDSAVKPTAAEWAAAAGEEAVDDGDAAA